MTEQMNALIEALEEAADLAEACRGFVDEQVDAFYLGKRPNWKQAATAVFDEIDSKPVAWRAVIARAKGE